uniref:Aspartate racemase n=1 Tax=Kalanchoe fedtschenkoi TaxID=63787 RepID=A0A7N0UZP3_KALFE
MDSKWKADLKLFIIFRVDLILGQHLSQLWFAMMRDCSTVTVCDSFLAPANTVGIIGGMSAGSSLKFLKKLVTWCSSTSGDGEGGAVPFVLCSDPTLHREMSAHEKNIVPCNFETERRDRTYIVNNLLQKRTFLEKAGVGCIVMPCHISHLWYDEVSRGCSIPFFHVGECVAKEIKEAKLKPAEAGSPLRIGVLGTSATLSDRIYQEKLQKQGFEVVIPDEATMEQTVNPAIQALHREDIEGAKTLGMILCLRSA